MDLTHDIGHGMQVRTTRCCDCGILIEYVHPNPDPKFDSHNALCDECDLTREG